MVAGNRYSQERLVHFLRMLQPAPPGWVAKAQRTIAEWLTSGRPAVDLTDLTRALEHDPAFRNAFDEDPIAAAEAAGWPELAQEFERELGALISLAERIAAEDAFRAELQEDPSGTLQAASVPRDAAEPLLRALGLQDDLLTKLPEVVAHQHEGEQVRARLLILLLGAAGVRETLRTRARRS